MFVEANESRERRGVALRIVVGTIGGLIGLLLIVAMVRPDMAMVVMHHVAAMMGM